jgi:hypothetical protein
VITSWPGELPGSGQKDTDSDELERRLVRSVSEGGFLALTAPLAQAGRAAAALAGRGAVATDLDALLIRHLRAVAAEKNIPDFGVVTAADADAPGSATAARVRALVASAVPRLEADVIAAGPVVLCTGIGLLDRYGHLDVIERLRDLAGTAASPLRTLWVLVPADAGGPPVLDGRPIPVLAAGQWATITPGWLAASGSAAA